jgi:hypothetical protein
LIEEEDVVQMINDREGEGVSIVGIGRIDKMGSIQILNTGQPGQVLHFQSLETYKGDHLKGTSDLGKEDRRSRGSYGSFVQGSSQSFVPRPSFTAGGVRRSRNNMPVDTQYQTV